MKGYEMTTSPRITARVSEEVQALLLQAASLSGISSMNAFVLSAAVEKAKSIVKEQQEMHLSSRDAMALVEALDAKPRHHARLSKAFAEYETKNPLETKNF
jgi:uncharacterized protein (DUF1778 family)